MAVARRAAESGNDMGGLLAVRLPAREDRETRDGIGAGPEGGGRAPDGAAGGTAGPVLAAVEVDAGVPFWRWELSGLPLPEADLVRASPGAQFAAAEGRR